MKFMGVDAGGTKTRMILCDENGNILSSVFGGPGNHLDIGIDGLKNTLLDCLQSVHHDLREIDACVLGLSGAGFSQKSCNRLCELIRPVIPARKLLVVNDCVIALKGSFGPERRSGTLIVAGTGSMVIGLDCNGQLYRTGGWGHIIGDVWSAYGIAFEAIKEVMRYWEDRGEFTTLVNHVESFLDLHSVDDVLRYFYVQKPSKSHLASFAPFVLESARYGDRIAQTIVQRAVDELVQAITPVIKSVNSDFLSYTGGLFRNPYFLSSVQNGVKRTLNIPLSEPYLPPIGGALIMAIESIIPTKEEIVQNLKKQFKEFENS
ncbi:MAG TPA: BadF/BadG/BcrA/BcrD ATPase family protein [Pseudothermotoga sp.]|nr:BadF/BadG/BcrA/BcrD ATPase family protein [Pseudothermotoga sp.]HOK83870.1 BadF/BadG/BcrA/BcrD ATPase family protein [Pseudothermotoga sp.]